MKTKITKEKALVSMNLTTPLFLIFLVLKLAKIEPVANWSWWWVTSPLWIPISILVGALLLIGVIALFTLFIVGLLK
jgi:hypothetical protein